MVGTELARWFGLPTAAFALFELPAEECIELPRGARMKPGPAFLSRHVPGRTWGGSADDLRALANPDDITQLVVFDTWVRNRDRQPPDAARRPNFANVYLAADGPGWRLLAIDHTHCFVTGGRLTAALANIGNVRDEATYGLFAAFAPLVSADVLARCGEALRSLPSTPCAVSWRRSPRLGRFRRRTRGAGRFHRRPCRIPGEADRRGVDPLAGRSRRPLR